MIDDKELIRKFTAGDEKAFDQIVQNNLIDYNDMILDTFHALKNDTR